MKIPVNIHIISKRLTSDISRRGVEEHPEEDVLSVSGTMKTTKEGFQIEYTEKGDDTFNTINTFSDGTVSINRVGALDSHMVYKLGKPHLCICDTGFFPLQMRISTKKLKNTLTLDGGILEIKYTVEIVGNLAEKNHLMFSVYPDISIIKS